MKKQEYDSIEKVYSTKRIPNIDEVNSLQNAEWWKKTYHSTDEEANNNEMFSHEIAFDGTKPLVIKQILRGKDRIHTSTFFDASFKRR